MRLLRQALPGTRSLRDVSLEDFRRSEERLPAVVARRCRFILEENARVLELAQALPDGDRDRLRRLCAASFSGASELYEIGAPAMDAMLSAMLSASGAVGARQAGAGFGGCMVALVDATQVGRFEQQVAAKYSRLSGVQPAIYAVQAAHGASVLLG